jgi:tetratricopeptide (TPR) repeat protein
MGSGTWSTPRLTWALAIGLSAPAAHAGPVEDAQSAEASGDVGRALAAWQRAAELAPEDARAQLSVGRLQLRAGRPAEAVQTLAAVVEKHPETPGAHYWYAFALRKSGRLPAAAESYRKALDAAPDDPDPRYGLAETLKQMGDGAGALEAYKAYVRLESRPSEAKWVARANEEIARLSASDVVTPADAPAEALPAPGPATAPPTAPAVAPASASPDTPTPEAAFAAGRFGEAQRGFRAELERSPDNIALHYRTAVAALSAGDYPEAERRAVTVVRLDPDNPTATAMALAARTRRPPAGPPARVEAELALREGRNRTAADLAGTLLSQAPTGPEAAALALIRGTALLRLGRADEAAEALRHTAGQGQPPGEYWLALGDALSAQGDRPAARRAWRVAADLTEAETPIGRLARERLVPAGLRVSEE